MVLVEAILYIDMGGKLVWEAINRCWGGRHGKGDINSYGGRYWKEGNKKDLWVR